MCSAGWILNPTWNSTNVGPTVNGALENLGDCPTYVDTNPVIAFPGQVVTGLALYFSGNRIMPQIQTAAPPASGAAWQPAWQPLALFDGSDPNYFPSNGCSGIGGDGNCTLYVDTTPLLAPAGMVAVGAALMEVVGNRIGAALLCVDASTLKNPQWVYNQSNNGDYFKGGANLGNFYVDTSAVTAGAGCVVTGFALYPKSPQGDDPNGNRIAPQIYVMPWSSFGS